MAHHYVRKVVPVSFLILGLGAYSLYNMHETSYSGRLTDLAEGRLALDMPSTMKSSETGQVTARIGSGEVTSLDADMAQHVITENIHITPEMEMTLKSADFDITPLSTQRQSVGGSEATTWEWHIVPKRSGTLHLHIAAILLLGNSSRDFAAVDRDISLRVDAVKGFIEENWKWIAGTLTAIFGAIWRFYKKKQQAPVPAEPVA